MKENQKSAAPGHYENELERKLRLEKVVASKHLRLAVETEEEQDWRMMPYMYMNIV